MKAPWKNIALALCFISIGASGHAQDFNAVNTPVDTARNVRLVILYQRFDWATLVDYGSEWFPIAAYKDETSCHAKVRKAKKIVTKEPNNGDTYLCQVARNDDEESIAKLLMAKQ